MATNFGLRSKAMTWRKCLANCGRYFPFRSEIGTDRACVFVGVLKGTVTFFGVGKKSMFLGFRKEDERTGGSWKKEMGVFLCACMYIYEYIVIGIHIYIVIVNEYNSREKKEFSDDQWPYPSFSFWSAPVMAQLLRCRTLISSSQLSFPILTQTLVAQEGGWALWLPLRWGFPKPKKKNCMTLLMGSSQ